MKFRPCIDIHNGCVKQIVGGSLRDQNDEASENYVSGRPASYYADMYYGMGLSGGHIILLNPADSPYYEQTRQQAVEALHAHPGFMQVGGGITADNAEEFLDAGASHVIVTSYVFRDGRINEENLQRLLAAVGREHLVLDLSCKRRGDDYYIVTDRWQQMTDTRLDRDTLGRLSECCDEFLVHAADVEGRQNGIEQEVVRILAENCTIPVTYAGGVHDLDDVRQIKTVGRSRIDVTVGSALTLFGGHMEMSDIIELM